jgi:hypothetical protein
MTNAETTTTTTDDAQTAVVLKSAAGDYYMVPLETLLQGRVSEERTTEVERLLSEQQDVQGHVVPLVVAGGLAFGYGVFAGNAIANLIMNRNSGDGGTKQLIDAFRKGAGQA